MAILKNDEKDNGNNTGQGQSPFLPTTSMPSNQTQAYTAPKKSDTTTGRFTNIQSYLNAANPDKAGQQSGGQQIQSGVQKAQEKNAESVREGIAKSQEQFGGQYNAENTRLTNAQPFIQNTLSSVTSPPPTSLNNGNAGLPSLTDDQIKQYRDLATGVGDYKNINGLVGAPDASGLESAAQMAGTEGGRYQLLNDTFKRPSYTSGQQKLDQLLLQTQSAAPLQKNLSQLANQVGGERTAAMSDADLKSQALKKLAGDVSTAATTGVGNAETSLENAVNNRVSSTQTSANNAYDDFQRALSGQKLTPEQSTEALKFAKDNNIDLNTGLYGIPGYQDFHPEQFLNKQEFNKQNVATPEERARADALAKLAGVDNTFLSGAAPTDNPSLNNVFNSAGFKEASDKRKAEYDSQYNPQKQQLDALTEIRNAWNDPNVQTLADALSKNQQYLDPSMYNRMIDSREFHDAKPRMGAGLNPLPNIIGDSGGAQPYRDYLGDIFRGTWEPKYNEVNSTVNKLNSDYSQGQTLESLLRNGYQK